jgi:hypothetical protein
MRKSQKKQGNLLAVAGLARYDLGSINQEGIPMTKPMYRFLMVAMVASLGLLSWGCGSTIPTIDSSLLSASSLDSQPMDTSTNQVTDDVDSEASSLQVAEQNSAADISDSTDDPAGTDSETDTPHHSHEAHSSNDDHAANQAVPPHCP